jgi:alpha-D-xyloside xylohydrolase
MTKTYEIPTFLSETVPVQFIARLEGVQQQGSSVLLACSTLRYEPQIHNFYGTRCEVTFQPGKPGDPIAVRFDFCSPEIMRVRCFPGDDVPEHDTPMVIGKFQQTVPLEIQQDGERVTIETSALQVVILRDPWQLQVFDHGGKQIWATRPVDIEPLRRPANQWNPPQERWLFLHRYGYPCGVRLGDRQTAFATFDLRYDEHIYGFGEDFGRLDKRNIERRLWLQECFGNASPAAYKQTPFYMSTRGYGLFVNTSNALHFKVGSLEHTALSVVVEDTSLLDFYLIYGPKFKDILPRYTAITGAPAVPPPWSFGLWMGRITYDNQEQVEQVAKDLRAHRIPCDVIHIDTGWYENEWVCDLKFSPRRFPDPGGMMARLREQGFRVCLWQLPNLLIESSLFQEAAEKGYLVKQPYGKPYLFSGFLSDAGLIDYSNPEAVTWIKAKFIELFEMGVAVIKADFGEGAPPEATYHGVASESMHNLFPLLYNQAVYEATEAFHGQGQALIWGRSAWAGSQRYPLHWSGDGIGRYEDLACVLRSALNFGLSGFPFYSHDVGGFCGLPCIDLYARWIQLGAFSSHVRCHGQAPREPWEYGEQTEEIFRQYMELRYRLLPYLYSEAIECGRTSMPMLRPLLLDYQDDPTTYTIEDQYLFGRSILVAPILDETGQRKVYLPAGEWTEYWEKTTLHGPCWIDITAPLDILPLYIRAGAIIPYAPLMQHVGEKVCDPLTVEIYPPHHEGAYKVHDVAGREIPVQYQRTDDQLVVGTGVAAGEIEIILFGVYVRIATLGEQQLDIRQIEHAGCSVCFDGRIPREIIFLIDES